MDKSWFFPNAARCDCEKCDDFESKDEGVTDVAVYTFDGPSFGHGGGSDTKRWLTICTPRTEKQFKGRGKRREYCCTFVLSKIAYQGYWKNYRGEKQLQSCWNF